MNIIDTNNSCDIEKLINFCKDSVSDDMPGSKNLEVDDWENKSHTLLHNLFIQHRFDKKNRAGYIIGEQDNKYIAGSGFYPLYTDPNICIAGTRTYTIIKGRGDFTHGNFILPKTQPSGSSLFGLSRLLDNPSFIHLHLATRPMDFAPIFNKVSCECFLLNIGFFSPTCQPYFLFFHP